MEMCMCLYSAKPTWRHGTASALTSRICILLWVKAVCVGAESVLQNCVIGDVFICILLHLPFYNEKKKILEHNFSKFGILAKGL